MSPRIVYITGATGLIGGALFQAFSNIGDDVSAVDFRRQSYLLGEADIAVHAAGYGQPDKFMATEPATIQNNVTDTAWFIDAIKPGGKFLFLSTSELYSGSPRIPHTEDDIGTTSPSHARAAYIESKRCGEALIHAARRRGINAKIARCSLIYGPGTRADDSRILNIMLRDAITKDAITLQDNGMAMRPYCYIDDAVEMLMNIVLRGKQAVYNVGWSGTETVSEAAALIGKIAGVPVHLGSGPPLPGSPLNVSIDISRYTREFGGKLFVSLENGLRRTFEWQKENLYAE